jgi:hypothetical protein
MRVFFEDFTANLAFIVASGDFFSEMTESGLLKLLAVRHLLYLYKGWKNE